ncbi:MAG: heparan-alpha-glucosaminide N-acetyltransferase domain-containing protein, partial [Clostridia bacterium]|nr:heparan-alpha-glucosaminide N-acetyltransferase domain-containing protein [Clostridia bacterium]
ALDKIPRRVAWPLWALLFIVTFVMPATYFVGIPHLIGFYLPSHLTSQGWLFALGVPDSTFVSADYFPMIPWFFLFMLGTLIGIPIKEHRLPKRFYTQRVPFFAFLGRHTLLIYILHQPIVFGILWMLTHVLKINL